ncbi:AmmeMemoRadiSam system radical SAM enzyme [Magnetovibrio sp. PR-2]|uniref:AmmeMemoRadiSam system radical SAM enzyme n=1 Tax=Magnetovibrio sp. PR-2 TaxID=3120356 RepID=UPI002FCE65A2
MDNIVSTQYWKQLDDGRIECTVCPRRCKLHDGQFGLCSVRGAANGQIYLMSYGDASGFCIDPIEKKPLNHFLPGTPILSFGQVGCNLTCRFCQNYTISKTKSSALQADMESLQKGRHTVHTQNGREFVHLEQGDMTSKSSQNWDISKSRQFDTLMAKASPERIAERALEAGCRSVAFTYNDPVIFLEYAVDTAKACHDLGLKTVAVTAGYIGGDARREFFSHMDAANVDLKCFTEDFYQKLCTARLSDVLETLVYLKHETDVWFELTTLLIPGQNDSDEELDAMTKWVVAELGPDVPMHFTAFHPDWKMRDIARTPHATLTKARAIALKNGVQYAYVGNVHDLAQESTYCHACGETLIGRDWYELSTWNVTDTGDCRACGTTLAGVFDGPPGTWGAKRLPLSL